MRFLKVVIISTIMAILACTTIIVRYSNRKPYVAGTSGLSASMKTLVDTKVSYIDKMSNGLFLREGDYPIVITIGDIGKNLMGLASIRVNSCTVTLSNVEKWNDDISFESTLVHEIAHCYGYEHESNKASLMYESHSDLVTHNTVLEFLKRMSLESGSPEEKIK